MDKIIDHYGNEYPIVGYATSSKNGVKVPLIDIKQMTDDELREAAAACKERHPEKYQNENTK